MSEIERLAEFARWVIREGLFDSPGLDCLDIQYHALRLGLIEQTTYDPNKHGPSDYADEGDEWFVFSPALSQSEGTGQ